MSVLSCSVTMLWEAASAGTRGTGRVSSPPKSFVVQGYVVRMPSSVAVTRSVAVAGRMEL
jgi:hypothetical protein